MIGLFASGRQRYVLTFLLTPLANEIPLEKIDPQAAMRETCRGMG